MSARQRAVLAYVATHPGCTAADVTRHEWRGRGHAASYARVGRLRRRRLLRSVPGRGGRVKLYTPDDYSRIAAGVVD
jgi:hypothetical protein